MDSQILLHFFGRRAVDGFAGSPRRSRLANWQLGCGGEGLRGEAGYQPLAIGFQLVVRPIEADG
jgi:hypothetical protein